MKLQGADELRKIFKQGLDSIDEIKAVLRTNGSEMQGAMVRYVPKKTHELKKSIKLQVKDNGLTVEVGPHKDYASYVEYGTRFMDAKPYVRPALHNQELVFKQDMERLFKKLLGG